MSRGIDGRALNEIVRSKLPDGMSGLVELKYSPKLRYPVVCIGLCVPDGPVVRAEVEIDDDSPADTVDTVLDALPDLIHKAWASGLSLTPDGDTDVRLRSYAIANAVDAAPVTVTADAVPDRCDVHFHLMPDGRCTCSG